MRGPSQDGCQPPTALTQALAAFQEPLILILLNRFCSVRRGLNLPCYETVAMVAQSREGWGSSLLHHFGNISLAGHSYDLCMSLF